MSFPGQSHLSECQLPELCCCSTSAEQLRESCRLRTARTKAEYRMRGQHCSGQQGGAEAIGAESRSCRRAALSQQGISLDTAFGDAGECNSFFYACHWEVWAALTGKGKSPQSTQCFPSFHGSGCSAAFLPLCKQPHSSSSHIPAPSSTPRCGPYYLHHHFTTPQLLQHWDCPGAQPTADFHCGGNRHCCSARK